MKVYELAKDLKIRSVDLVEKLRSEWGIPVKNHMQKLSESDMEKIQVLLAKKEQKTSPVLVKKRVSKVAIKKIAKPAVQEPVATSVDVSDPVPVLRTGIIRRKKTSPEPLATTSKEKKKPTSTSAQKTSSVEASLSTAESSRPIRQGLVSGESADILKTINESIRVSEAEADKKKVKRPSTDKGGQGNQFRATDFRKREMIFQPKKKRLFAGVAAKSTKITKPKSHKRVLKIYDTISIEGLSHKIGVKKHTLISKAKKEGLLKEEDITTHIPADTATLIASLFDFEVKNLSKKKENINELSFGDLKAEKQIKPPVVTVMGHVDHGKTTLLDYIRKTRVASGEAGGITQHIGAYSVPVADSFVTFIDTPGHAAFTALRLRGSQVTDIAVIVVAADDGVQPQTVEAIHHAQNAKVPILVAINKIDLPDVDIEKVKKQLSDHKLVPEEWGGDTIFCSLSAKKGDGVKELLEHIHLLAEMHELKANPLRSGEGVVLESRVQKGRGQVMTLLVQDGTLKTSQIILIGRHIGKIRQITNDIGQVIPTASPGQAIEISGIQGEILAGDKFYAVKSEKEARKWLAEFQLQEQAKLDPEPETSAEELLLQAHAQQTKAFNIVLKTDVAGSAEAVKHSLEKINTDEVKSHIIHSGLGVVNENDVLLAQAGSAVIFCFNVGVDSKASYLASQKAVAIQSYKVIYELLDAIEKQMAGLLDPEVKETFGGRAEVRQVFQISNLGAIAGCYISKGKIGKDHFVRVMRDEKQIHEEPIHSLKHLKQSVKSVSEGQECGIGFQQYKDFQVGDILESFSKTEIKREKL